MYLLFPRARLRVHLLAVPVVCMMFLLEGAVPAGLILLAAGLHECGHLAALRLFGIPIRRMDILPMGAVIAYDDSLCPHRQTAWVAFAGAGANLTAASVCLPFAEELYVLFFVLANTALAVVNLLPIESLDGGTILRSVLSAGRTVGQNERICRAVSRASLVLLAAFFAWIGLRSSFPIWHLLLSAVMLAQIFR